MFTNEEFSWAVRNAISDCIELDILDVPNSEKSHLIEFVKGLDENSAITLFESSIGNTEFEKVLFEASNPKVKDTEHFLSAEYIEKRNSTIVQEAPEPAYRSFVSTPTLDAFKDFVKQQNEIITDLQKRAIEGKPLSPHEVKVLRSGIKTTMQNLPKMSGEQQQKAFDNMLSMMRGAKIDPKLVKSIDKFAQDKASYQAAASAADQAVRMLDRENTRLAKSSVWDRFMNKLVEIPGGEKSERQILSSAQVKAQKAARQAEAEFQKSKEQMVDRWTSFQNSQRSKGNSFNLGTSGKVILITAGIVALATVAYLVYLNYFSKAAQACKGSKGYAKKACMYKFKIKAAQEAIRKLQEALEACDQSTNPSKCKWSVTRKIRNWQAKISNWQTKLANTESKMQNQKKDSGSASGNDSPFKLA